MTERAMSMNAPEKQPGQVRLTHEQAKSRRARNLAIGLSIGFFAVLFYAITVVKLGPGVLTGGQ